MANSYSDLMPGHRVEISPLPDIQPATVLPAVEAAQRVYERGSIAETLQRMFNEIDQNPEAFMPAHHEYAQEIYPSDTEAFQSVLVDIQVKLKSSDAVKNLKNALANGREIAVNDVEAVFRAYDQTFRDVIAKFKSRLSPKQINILKFQGRSELDWNYRDVVTRHIVAASEQDMKFDPLDFFLVLNPKARKIDYMEKGEILATLRHSMSTAGTTTERLTNDLHTVESAVNHPEAQALLRSPEVEQLKAKLT